jgi:hypothetical protein
MGHTVIVLQIEIVRKITFIWKWLEISLESQDGQDKITRNTKWKLVRKITDNEFDENV